MSIRLYVGNLPKTDVEREDLQAVFVEVGELVSVKTIKDRKTGKCRGFGFVTVETEEQADRIIELYNGTMFQELPLSIEKALPKAKGQEDDDGDSSEPKEPKEPKAPSNVPKPTLSINKVPSTAETPRRSSGGGKKGGRKESNKGNTTTTTTTNAPATTESFQPDPRWAGKLAELKDKLAQSGNA
jgi:RNA recognition motif-containing protein